MESMRAGTTLVRVKVDAAGALKDVEEKELYRFAAPP